MVHGSQKPRALLLDTAIYGSCGRACPEAGGEPQAKTEPSPEQAQAFAGSDELRETMQRAGVTGPPRIEIAVEA